MRPVSPPGMPNTYSMPASSRTRTSAWGTSMSAGVTVLTSGLSRRESAASAKLDAEVLGDPAVVLLVGEIAAHGDPGFVADPCAAGGEADRILPHRPAQ